MAIVSMEIDPAGRDYTDDEIVGKVNAATAKVSADQTVDGSTNKVFTGDDESKLGGIEAGAKADQTGDEIITAIDAGSSKISRSDSIDYDALNLIKTGPPAGGFKVKQVDRTSDGKLDIKYDEDAVT
jgi:hypothetical protein